MARIQHLRRRKNHFIFRMRMPKSLFPVAKCRYIERSLGTADFTIAKLMAQKMSAQIKTVLIRLKAGIMTYEEIQGIVDKWLAGILTFDEEWRFRDGTKPRGGGLENKSEAELQEYYTKVQEALATKNWSYGSTQADMVLFEKNQHLDKNSPEYRNLCFECLKGQQELLAILLERKKGQYLNPFDRRADRVKKLTEVNTLQSAPADEQKKAPLLSVLIKQHLAEKLSDKSWSRQTYDERRTLLNLFLEFVGDRPVTEINRMKVIEFRDVLRRLPPGGGKSLQNRKVPLADLLKHTYDKVVAPVTVNNRLTMLIAFFNWVKNVEPVFNNPAAGIKIRDRNKLRDSEERSPYDNEDLTKIFTFLPGKVKPEQYPYRVWVPLIALFTGMRLNEICQLHCDDIGQEKDVWFFNIRANPGHHQRVKTATSIRKVPIHPKLQELGMLQYWEYVRTIKKKDRLFSDLTYTERSGYSRNMKNWWGAKFSRRLITKDPKKNFHSFRHTFSTQMKHQGIPDAVTEEIVGHVYGSGEHNRYAKPFTVEILYQHLSKLVYPDVDFSKMTEACNRTFQRDLDTDVVRTQRQTSSKPELAVEPKAKAVKTLVRLPPKPANP